LVERESLLVDPPARLGDWLFLTGGLVFLAAYWLIDRQGVSLRTEEPAWRSRYVRFFNGFWYFCFF